MTADYTLVRRTIEHLAVHTTWPTEFKQYFIRLVYEDWMHGGSTDLVRRHWALMRDVKSWRRLRRGDGLVVSPGEMMTPSPDGGKFCDIVDWAKCYRDGFVFTPVNVVVNALHYRNLRELEAMARAIGFHLFGHPFCGLDIKTQVTLKDDRIDEIVVTAAQRATYRSGGR